MNKTLLFLVLGTCTVILSVAVISVGPNINNIHGQSTKWATQNCELIGDQIKLLRGDITTLKKMKNLCYREKAMYHMEYAAFIINIIVGFVCADLALIHHLGYGKDFEVKSGIIGLIGGGIAFILTLVYVCYSGYIFCNDVAYMQLDIGLDCKYVHEGLAVEKLYSNGAKYKWVPYDDANAGENDGIYVTEYDNDRNDFSNYIRYRDLGKKQYNYNSKYYKSYMRFNDEDEIENICKCPSTTFILENNPQKPNGEICEYLYDKPAEGIENRKVFDKWISSLVLACVTLLTNLGIAFFGLLHCANFGAGNSGI